MVARRRLRTRQGYQHRSSASSYLSHLLDSANSPDFRVRPPAPEFVAGQALHGRRSTDGMASAERDASTATDSLAGPRSAVSSLLDAESVEWLHALRAEGPAHDCGGRQASRVVGSLPRARK
jgi:hypothetical protein